MAVGYVSTRMDDCLSLGPTVECIEVGISFCHETFINSSALLVSLMALGSHKGTKTPFGLVFVLFYFCTYNWSYIRQYVGATVAEW